MSIFKRNYTTLIILSILSQFVFAGTLNCCLQQGNVCGDKCCDGTPLPANCGDFQIIKLPPPAAPRRAEENAPNEPPPKWLYIWNDPHTGTPYLSNTFPPWYRNPQYPDNYPHVLVYDKYNRLIDDTGKKMSVSDTLKFRKKAESNLQQQAAYQQAKKTQVEMQAKQIRLNKLLKEWAETGKVTKEMTKLLEELAAAKQVTMAMTEKQVKQAWGTPQSRTTKMVNGKFQKTLKYKKGEIIINDGRVKQLKEKNK